jgi:hypothetical protein
MTRPRPAVGKVWTEQEIRALGVRLDGVTACNIIYGDGRTKAYERLRSGDVDFPVLRRGRYYIVATAKLLPLLGLAEEGHPP